jgi:hypothetical protein
MLFDKGGQKMRKITGILSLLFIVVIGQTFASCGGDGGGGDGSTDLPPVIENLSLVVLGETVTLTADVSDDRQISQILPGLIQMIDGETCMLLFAGPEYVPGQRQVAWETVFNGYVWVVADSSNDVFASVANVWIEELEELYFGIMGLCTPGDIECILIFNESLSVFAIADNQGNELLGVGWFEPVLFVASSPTAEHGKEVLSGTPLSADELGVYLSLLPAGDYWLGIEVSDSSGQGAFDGDYFTVY